MGNRRKSSDGVTAGISKEPQHDSSKGLAGNDVVKRHSQHYELSTTKTALALLSSILLAFGAGRMAAPFLKEHYRSLGASVNDTKKGNGALNAEKPNTILGGPLERSDGKGMVVGPVSVYTFEDFDASDLCFEDEKEETTNETFEGVRVSQVVAPPKAHTNGEALVHPISSTSEHLIVDMEGVDGDFLNSDVRLSEAIVETARRADMRLRSYHCHSLTPAGVSCVGMLEKGHLAFHTWPDEGVITLDLFSWGFSKPGTLIHFKGEVAEVFGPSRTSIRPTVNWSQQRRGFHANPLSDSAIQVGGLGNDLNELVAFVQTRFQLIEIYDELDRRVSTGMAEYKKALAEDDSYYARNLESFDPDRLVHLNGVLQSSRDGDAAYHEALVHPAMFAHERPERVAIIGGGEGATLREVLKHNTIKQAIMVEIDELMISTSRTYLPRWNTCQDIIGSTECCFDDPRANVYTEDALAWFIDRFYSPDGVTANANGLKNAEPMDVIIMDALDPEDQVAFCDVLYNNDVFMESLYNSLTESGILVMQLGEGPESRDAAESLTVHHHRASITKQLQEVGFNSIHVYTEGNCNFDAPWTYLVAFKDRDTRSNWYANEAEIALEMHQRAMPTKSGQSPFLHFDGSTMALYQVPHRAFQAVFCREDPAPDACAHFRGFEPNKCVDSFSFSPYTVALLSKMLENDEDSALDLYERFVHDFEFEEEKDLSVNTCMVDRGLNRTSNIKLVHHVAGFANISANSDGTRDSFFENSLYNPLVDRHRRHLNSGWALSHG